VCVRVRVGVYGGDGPYVGGGLSSGGGCVYGDSPLRTDPTPAVTRARHLPAYCLKFFFFFFNFQKTENTHFFPGPTIENAQKIENPTEILYNI